MAYVIAEPCIGTTVACAAITFAFRMREVMANLRASGWQESQSALKPKIAQRDDKEAAMGQFVKVGTRGEFEGLEAGKLVQAGGQNIAIFDVGGSCFAIENMRPHRGGPLSEGTVAGGEGRSKSFGFPRGARARCLKRQGSGSQ